MSYSPGTVSGAESPAEEEAGPRAPQACKPSGLEVSAKRQEPLNTLSGPLL